MSRLGVYGRTYLLAGLLLLAGLVLAYQFVRPAPPDRLVMATGPEGGAYRRYAEVYREIFARNGIELELRATAGSVENLRLLQDDRSGVQVALIQGGLAAPDADIGLQTMGGMFLEPLWVFTRLQPPPTRLADLAGRRLAIGPEDSGTRAQALKLLAGSGIGAGSAQLLPLGGTAAKEALAAGSVDAVFLVGAASANGVWDLARTPGVRPMDFVHATAYAQLDRTIAVATLARGAFDFRHDVPATDVRMPATTADLVVRADLHPALKDLLMVAAAEVHRAGSLFSPPGTYPARYQTDLPLAPEAARFYADGPPFLQRYLPFWAANLVERLAVLLIPLLTILLPLIRLLPPVVTWQIQSRVYRWYARLSEVESAVAQGDRREIEAARAELAQIDREISRIRVPLSYNYLVYRLRSHLDLVRGRVEEAAGRSAPSGEGQLSAR